VSGDTANPRGQRQRLHRLRAALEDLGRPETGSDNFGAEATTGAVPTDCSFTTLEVFGDLIAFQDAVVVDAP
jgi:hypothetical protein